MGYIYELNTNPGDIRGPPPIYGIQHHVLMLLVKSAPLPLSVSIYSLNILSECQIKSQTQFGPSKHKSTKK